jgi:hypothetical protein
MPPEQASGRVGKGVDGGTADVGGGVTGVIATGVALAVGTATGKIGLMPARPRSVAPSGMAVPPRDVIPAEVTAPEPGTAENPTAHGELLDSGSTFDVGTDGGASAQLALVGSVVDGLSPPT